MRIISKTLKPEMLEEELRKYCIYKVNFNVANRVVDNPEREMVVIDWDNVEVIDSTYDDYAEAHEEMVLNYVPEIVRGKYRTKGTLYFIYDRDLVRYRGVAVWDCLVIYDTPKNEQLISEFYRDYEQYMEFITEYYEAIADVIIDEEDEFIYRKHKYNEIKDLKKITDAFLD